MSSEVEVIFENMVISSEMKARRKKTAKTTSQSEGNVKNLSKQTKQTKLSLENAVFI